MSDWLPAKYAKWANLRDELGLSDEQVQMVRDLGMDVDRCRKLHTNPPDGLAFGQYLTEQYRKRLGMAAPEEVKSIEAIVAERQEKKAQRQKLNEIKAMMGQKEMPPHRLQFKVEIENSEDESEES